MVRVRSGAPAWIDSTTWISRATLLGRGTLQGHGAERRQRRLGRSGSAQQGLKLRRRHAGDLGNRGRVLAVERLAQRRQPRASDVQTRGQGVHQGRQVEIDGEPPDSDRGQRLRGEHDRLGVGPRRSRADQLRADLGELALGPKLAALDPKHLAAVAQPQRPRRLAQPGRRDASHLGRHVGAQSHHALADRVHEPEGLLRHGGAGAGQDCFLEFEQRRLDPFVAAAGEAGDQPLDHRGLLGGLGRQDILETGGQQGLVTNLGHEHLRIPVGTGRWHGLRRASLRVDAKRNAAVVTSAFWPLASNGNPSATMRIDATGLA